jgi:hypothetical protein
MPFPIEEKYVEQTEHELGAKLPSWFRVKMMSENGGELSAMGDVWDLIPIKNPLNRKTLERTCNDLLRESESAKGFPGFPPNAVTIAQNGTGDYLMFLKQEDGTFDNRTYHFNHETGEVRLKRK